MSDAPAPDKCPKCGSDQFGVDDQDFPHMMLYNCGSEFDSNIGHLFQSPGCYVIQLEDAIRKIDQTLRSTAAEYVPAIGDVFKIIDELQLRKP